MASFILKFRYKDFFFEEEPSWSQRGEKVMRYIMVNSAINENRNMAINYSPYENCDLTTATVSLKITLDFLFLAK